MILLTGDKHGGYNNSFSTLTVNNFPLQKELTKKDYLIFLGDFWLVGDSQQEKIELLNWLDNSPWTTLFVDWNHENFDALLQLPEILMFWDFVGKVTDSIYHLKRGKVYTINSSKFFVMWWALSTDKNFRTPWIDWWPQETPDSFEFRLGYENLEKHNNKVDYIISHTCPESIIDKMFWKWYSENKDIVSKYFNSINNIVEFKHWYFWHFHENKTFQKYTVLYEDILLLQ